MVYYRDDLAHIHDAGHSAFVDGVAPNVVALLRRAGIRRGLVVELGCGSGRLARALSAAGYEVLGFDLSSSMIRLARRTASKARFRVGSAFSVRLPFCAAVVSVGETLNYLFDRQAGPAGLARLFRQVAAILPPGGMFLFDLAGPGQVAPPGTRQAHREGPGWATLVDAVEDRRRNLLTRRITSFRRLGRGFRRTTEIHVQRLYPASEVARLLRGAGFSVMQRRGYGDFLVPPRHTVYLARKR